MLILIAGGSASGKSEMAERVAVNLNRGRLAYIATMEIYGDESRSRIAKHQKMREGKGFDTLECPSDLFHQQEYLAGYDTALLECTSNLLFNEMFTQGRSAIEAVEVIAHDLLQLTGRLRNLIMVSGTVFLDFNGYDDFTNNYVQALGKLNCALARSADIVIEVVCSIPLVHKGKKEISQYENFF